MRVRHKLTTIVTGLTALGACSVNPSSNGQLEPLKASLGGVNVVVPRNAIYDQTTASTSGGLTDLVTFKLCPQRGKDRARAPGCEVFDQLSIEEEVFTRLHAALPARRFPSLTERPQGGEPPAAPLLPYRKADAQTPDASASGDYALNRLRLMNRSGPTTTDRGWPIVACDDRSQSQVVICVAAFAVRGIFVEATWRSLRSNSPNQRQAWRTAVAVDEKVRPLFQ